MESKISFTNTKKTSNEFATTTHKSLFSSPYIRQVYDKYRGEELSGIFNQLQLSDSYYRI